MGCMQTQRTNLTSLASVAREQVGVLPSLVARAVGVLRPLAHRGHAAHRTRGAAVVGLPDAAVGPLARRNKLLSHWRKNTNLASGKRLSAGKQQLAIQLNAIFSIECH